MTGRNCSASSAPCWESAFRSPLHHRPHLLAEGGHEDRSGRGRRRLASVPVGAGHLPNRNAALGRTTVEHRRTGRRRCPRLTAMDTDLYPEHADQLPARQRVRTRIDHVSASPASATTGRPATSTGRSSRSSTLPPCTSGAPSPLATQTAGDDRRDPMRSMRRHRHLPIAVRWAYRRGPRGQAL